MATEVKAPGEYNKLLGPKIFLGGAIDQGKAQDWQSRVVRACKGTWQDCLRIYQAVVYKAPMRITEDDVR